MEKKIVLAFDSFKDCMTAQEACEAAAKGVRMAFPNASIIEQPLSDGGEGLVNCIKTFIPTTTVSICIHGPLNDIISATYLLSSDKHTAYMEIAAACGLMLIPNDKRNPMTTTSYGVGEMIADAINKGCKNIIIGLGGSGTCDAGKGMIEALNQLKCNIGECNIIAACDVRNPLYGKDGAAYVFAPQKGATTEQVAMLDKQLHEFARKTENLGLATTDQAYYPGAGAAGGLGYALLTYLKAKLQPGIDIVLDIIHFDQLIADADMVITGEGKSDEQTMMGKVACGVLKRCKKQNIPAWLVSGIIEDKSGVLATNFDKVICINENDNRNHQLLLKKYIAMNNLTNTLAKHLNLEE